MRRKLKLSMIDDYIAIFKIIFICKTYKLLGEEATIKNAEYIENNAIILQQKYEYTFEKTGQINTSFLLLKSQLIDATENISPNSLDLSKHKLESLNEKLKILEIKHNANSLKLKYKKR